MSSTSSIPDSHLYSRVADRAPFPDSKNSNFTAAALASKLDALNAQHFPEACKQVRDALQKPDNTVRELTLHYSPDRIALFQKFMERMTDANAEVRLRSKRFVCSVPDQSMQVDQPPAPTFSWFFKSSRSSDADAVPPKVVRPSKCARLFFVVFTPEFIESAANAILQRAQDFMCHTVSTSYSENVPEPVNVSEVEKSLSPLSDAQLDSLRWRLAWPLVRTYIESLGYRCRETREAKSSLMKGLSSYSAGERFTSFVISLAHDPFAGDIISRGTEISHRGDAGTIEYM